MASPAPSPPRSGDVQASLAAIAGELVRLEGRLLELEEKMRSSIERVPPGRREGARNLVHYVALRQYDLRELQVQLSMRGLSSLGRSESCVLGTLLEVSTRVHEALALHGDEGALRELSRLEERRSAAMSWETAKRHLHQHTHDVLGPRPEDRHIYVMVTAPSADEADRAWMAKMLRAGMNVLRVNCAHEGPGEWTRVVRALADARSDTGKPCRVLMDLAGPKIRTGTIAGARRIVTWKPAKDDLGAITTPARVVISRASALREEGVGPHLRMGDDDLAKVKKGDELRFQDARGKKCALRIQEVDRDRVVGASSRRAYLLDGVRARVRRDDANVAEVTIEVMGTQQAAIDVVLGDSLVLTKRAVEGHPPRRDPSGGVEEPGVIACTLPAALDHLEEGHRVLFDDGSIHAVVERVEKRGDFLLRVVRTQKENAKLRAEKGINLPDTLTKVPSLTEDDLAALPFVAEHADAVSLSFVRRPDDVRALHDALEELGRSSIGVVLKIETRAGFENLPRLLLEGMRRPPLGVMIARGDLAVEVGFERLAELQEEILWLCEASHVPAIWATQVLDTLARTGVPSRAEVTDAAASVAAECVMLNKGPFVDEAVSVLVDILGRMEKHHYKKRSLFRKLRVSTFGEP